MNRRDYIAYLVLALGICSSQALNAETKTQTLETGTVHIFVEDPNGVYVANAFVYISDGQKIVDIVETEANGAITVNLPQGNYVMSSAVSDPHRDGLDRFASREAQVPIISQDTTTVILTLQPVGDPMTELSLSTLKRIGVADEVAKYLN